MRTLLVFRSEDTLRDKLLRKLHSVTGPLQATRCRLDMRRCYSSFIKKKHECVLLNSPRCRNLAIDIRLHLSTLAKHLHVGKILLNTHSNSCQMDFLFYVILYCGIWMVYSKMTVFFLSKSDHILDTSFRNTFRQ